MGAPIRSWPPRRHWLPSIRWRWHRGIASYWLAGCWAAWTLLWLCFIAVGALQRQRWNRPVAWLTIAQSVLTAWLPGYLLLSGRMVL
jgi:AmiS/UreI family transporter